MISQTVKSIEKEFRYVSSHINQKGKEILRKYSITSPQFLALHILFENGDMTIGELSNKMYLAFSTTTELVHRMEKNELVKRVKKNDDRRVVQVHLMDEGRRIVNEVIKERQMYLHEKLNHLTQEDVESLHTTLLKLKEIMKD